MFVVGAVASLGTSSADVEVSDDEYVRARLSDANPIAVWRMDVDLSEEAVAPEAYLRRGEVDVDVSTNERRLGDFDSGDFALYVIGDPSVTIQHLASSPDERSVVAQLNCGVGAPCVRTVYLVVERRIASGAASLYLSASAEASFGKSDEPSGAEIDVSLTRVDEFSSVTARTDRTVAFRAEVERTPSYEYMLGVSASAGISPAIHDVVGYAAAWGDVHGSIDLFDPEADVGGTEGGTYAPPFDPIALTDECLSGPACDIDLRVRVQGQSKVAWWAEARLIFLGRAGVPEGAAVSLEVREL